MLTTLLLGLTLFDSSPLMQNSIIFLGKNLSNFVSPFENSTTLIAIQWHPIHEIWISGWIFKLKSKNVNRYIYVLHIQKSDTVVDTG